MNLVLDLLKFLNGKIVAGLLAGVLALLALWAAKMATDTADPSARQSLLMLCAFAAIAAAAYAWWRFKK